MIGPVPVRPRRAHRCARKPAPPTAGTEWLLLGWAHIPSFRRLCAAVISPPPPPRGRTCVPPSIFPPGEDFAGETGKNKIKSRSGKRRDPFLYLPPPRDGPDRVPPPINAHHRPSPRPSINPPPTHSHPITASLTESGGSGKKHPHSPPQQKTQRKIPTPTPLPGGPL